MRTRAARRTARSTDYETGPCPCNSNEWTGVRLGWFELAPVGDHQREYRGDIVGAPEAHPLVDAMNVPRDGAVARGRDAAIDLQHAGVRRSRAREPARRLVYHAFVCACKRRDDRVAAIYHATFGLKSAVVHAVAHVAQTRVAIHRLA